MVVGWNRRAWGTTCSSSFSRGRIFFSHCYWRREDCYHQAGDDTREGETGWSEGTDRWKAVGIGYGTGEEGVPYAYVAVHVCTLAVKTNCCLVEIGQSCYITKTDLIASIHMLIRNGVFVYGFSYGYDKSVIVSRHAFSQGVELLLGHSYSFQCFLPSNSKARACCLVSAPALW